MITDPKNDAPGDTEENDIIIDVEEPVSMDSEIPDKDPSGPIFEEDEGEVLTSAAPDVILGAGLKKKRKRRDPSLDPTLLGRYKILDVLGRGAFSIVYRASQVGIGRIVALKVFLLPPATRQKSTSAEAALARFQREARLAAGLRHPNTVTLFDYDKTETGILYMAFEYVRGPTLSKEIKANPEGMSIPRALDVAGQVAYSLDEAHAQSIIHRDLKPGNIMITRQQGKDDYVKVLDFGIAKLVGNTERDPDFNPEQTNVLDVFDPISLRRTDDDLTLNGRIVGTPRYIPPEQIRAEPLTPAADIYALGLILHEMLTGRSANPGKKPQELIAWHLDDLPFDTPPDYKSPPGLAHVIQKATRKDPKERYQSCQAFLDDLERLNDKGEWVKAPRKARMVMLAVATNAALLLVLAGLGYNVMKDNMHRAESTESAAGEASVKSANALAAKDTSPILVEAAEAEEDKKSEPKAPVEAPEAPEAKQLEIISEPAGAAIFIGDLHIGTTPLSLTLEAEQVDLDVILKKPGFRNANIKWTVSQATSPFPVKLKPAPRKTKPPANNQKKKPKYHILP